MPVEVKIWLAVALIGLGVIPFVWKRRRNEAKYVKIVGATPARKLIIQNRTVRAFLLCIAVFCASGVAFVAWLLDPEDGRRYINIVLLIVLEIAVVATLWIDEWYAARVQKRIEEGDEIG